MVSNGPRQPVILRLQARKSFSLGLIVTDAIGAPLDIAGVTQTIVMRKKVTSTVTDDSANLITNSDASIVGPGAGYSRFDLQASDLDHPAGDYIFTITMNDGGFSSAIVNGEIVLEQNTEFASVGETYTPGTPATILQVAMREQQTIQVSIGTLLPGEATFTTALEQKLLEMYAGLLAAGLTLTADDIPDGVTKVMMTALERAALADTSVSWTDVSGKPLFGSASTEDSTAFLPAAGINADKIISGTIDTDRLPVTFGEPDPVSLPEGHFYFQYEA